MSLKLVPTKDGSQTLFSETYAAAYHSLHGAILESQHVFIQNGLQQWLDKGYKNLRIFEMGFGTGLNCLLSWKAAQNRASKIMYETVEQYPLEQSIVEALAPAYGQEPDAIAFFEQMHHCDWEKPKELSPGFILLKHEIDVRNYRACEPFHLIYYDAFPPGTQPDLWEEVQFRKMRDLLVPAGQMVTYCAKGDVKRCLKEVGFAVETLPGPPGKREMIRATRLA